MSGNIKCTDDAILAIGRAVEWDMLARDGRRMGTLSGELQQASPGKVRIDGMWCRLQDLPNLRIKSS